MKRELSQQKANDQKKAKRNARIKATVGRHTYAQRTYALLRARGYSDKDARKEQRHTKRKQRRIAKTRAKALKP